MSAQRRGALARYFFRLGAIGFGGPVALVARMRHDLVDRHAWVADEDFREGLALAQVAPGPLAAQLAMYLGWLADGVLGATLVGVAFVLPSLVIVLALAAGYARSGGLPVIGALFYGVGAAVIAVLARAGFRLARATIARDRLLWVVTGVNAAATVALRRESVLLVLASGLFVVLARSKTRTADTRSLSIGAASILSPLTGGALGASSLPALFAFFATSGLVVFGSGLAIVPFLHGGVVVERHWLTEQQFLDAVAVSLLTPGPVVITVAFIGYLVAGMAGGIVAAVGVFLPAFLVVLLLAPRFRAIRSDGRARAFASGVTSAAVGALLGAVAVMATRTLVDLPTAMIAVAALIWLLVRPRVPEPLVLAAAAVVGLVVHRWS